MSMGPRHYLFDWGDTLMVDFPQQDGPMYNWPEVKLVDGAKECLQRLSQHTPCHVATNAEDSSESQIRQALDRAEIGQYITHIFCRENLEVGKAHPDYYKKIVRCLDVPAEQVTMVGDSLERDIYPALNTCLKAIWFNPSRLSAPQHITSINQYAELL